MVATLNAPLVIKISQISIIIVQLNQPVCTLMFAMFSKLATVIIFETMSVHSSADTISGASANNHYILDHC